MATYKIYDLNNLIFVEGIDNDTYLTLGKPISQIIETGKDTERFEVYRNSGFEPLNIGELLIGNLSKINGDPWEISEFREWISKNTSSFSKGGGSGVGATLVELTSTSNSTSWAGSDSSVYSLTLEEDTTLENPTSPVTGQDYQFIIKQDSNGSHSLSYGDIFKFEGGTVPSVEISANSISVITLLYDGSSLLSVAVKNFL